MSYQIEIEVPAIEGLQQKLQSAYDSGAAGFFKLHAAGEAVKIVFDREISDDVGYIEWRMERGIGASRAACEQLAAEFDESSPGDLGPVILALRSGAGVVHGLDDLEVKGQPAPPSPSKKRNASPSMGM